MVPAIYVYFQLARITVVANWSVFVPLSPTHLDVVLKVVNEESHLRPEVPHLA